MAVTFKRPPAKIEGSNRNYSQHLNQMGFKGIVHKNNLFDVDPLSLRDAKNVYLDENSVLVSRDPIIVEALPTGYILVNSQTVATPIAMEGYGLIDIFETGKTTIYVMQNMATKLCRIVAMHNESKLLAILPELVTKYHISAVERYIIVFNDKDAVVLDVDIFVEGWKFLREVAEIPITKRVVGQEVFTNSANQFTESYKEQYIWSEDVASMLPEGTAEVEVNQSPKSIKWTLTNAHINTEARILRPINVPMQLSDIMTVATNINTGVNVICIARSSYVLISLNDGLSFERILYPANDGYLNIASVSKDGLCFFFVAEDGVYRYNISDKSWTTIRITTEGRDPRLSGTGLDNTCCFNNAEVFSFVLYKDELGVPVANIYWKGPGLQSSQFDHNTLGLVKLTNLVNPLNQSTKTRTDCAPSSLFVTVENGNTLIAAWLPGVTSNTTNFTIIIGRGESEELLHYDVLINRPYGTIDSLKTIINSTFKGVEITGLTVDNNLWYKVNATIGKLSIPDTELWVGHYEFRYTGDTQISLSDHGAPMDIVNSYLVNLNSHSIDGVETLPTELDNQEWPGSLVRHFTISLGPYFYMRIGDTIYTNKMVSSSNTTITYTRLVNTPYTKIPDVSHVNNELYLGFGNIIKITANERTSTNLRFNLPIINDHAFTSNVNGMINISTTEVAIFLIDQVYLVTQVYDELLGYRYDYYNTRLSTGVRLGDSILNTKNGVYTLYPTIQGLAVMNYQPDVATTEQMVDYVTKDITDIWNNFYRTGHNINLIQMGDYVFLTNGTTTYLMLDLRGLSWWYFDSPIPVMKMITDQFELHIISNGLYKFDKQYTGYKDLYNKFIDWKIESQPLHFGAPNHYKNMKQIIYQFVEASTISQTIDSQIKLYRKQITYKAPETIDFKVDGYRTFVKRFNYWKINELQWALAADHQTTTPAPLRLNGLTIKYEKGEEVRS